MKSVVGTALAISLSLVCSMAFAGSGGNGSGNPRNDNANTVVTQEPIYLIQDGKLVPNPKR